MIDILTKTLIKIFPKTDRQDHISCGLNPEVIIQATAPTVDFKRLKNRVTVAQQSG